MDKNLIYRSLHLHYVKGLKLSEVSDTVGFTERKIRAIIEGTLEPEVATDFFEDRKIGKYSRTYSEPVYKKLSKLDYAYLQQKYMSSISSGQSIKLIRSYLLEDCIEPKQAEKMYKGLEAFYEVKKVELMDAKLQAVLNVLAMPSKWSLKDTGLETVYAVPILDDKFNVIAVEYKPNKSFIFPEELWCIYELIT
ncbi:hypothetical protein QWY16_09370 [Planococcus shenhongbingii]|uniref:hypothetical protein n=1 Tax=Planococcus shenhongbingii TaxID=3058398 RepID=UPI00260751A7|nr:hypothetical protein [Planococcus sp. N016]WKA60293.1 hypothetical protein QWY16_09370 [Planococcus sp. N016]